MEKAAKFVDMLSAIGGTMGLLTGFSIISGVEILYFTAKIILNLVWNRKDLKTHTQKRIVYLDRPATTIKHDVNDK